MTKGPVQSIAFAEALRKKYESTGLPERTPEQKRAFLGFKLKGIATASLLLLAVGACTANHFSPVNQANRSCIASARASADARGINGFTVQKKHFNGDRLSMVNYSGLRNWSYTNGAYYC